MKGYEENNCRLCKKIFCCKKCREKHEKTTHDIFPNCDICIYGNVQLASASPGLVEHIKGRHWPLHCLICKRLFGSMDELFQHNKCPIGHRIKNESLKSPYQPVQSYAGNPYDSPGLSSNLSNHFHEKRHQSNKKNISKLATSTPMQRADDNSDNLWEKIHEVIVTPEYYSVNIKNSIIKKSQSDSTRSGSFMKSRRVTFGENPLIDSEYNSRSMATSGTSSSEYHSAKEEQTQYTDQSKISANDIQNIPSIKVTDATHIKEDNTEDGQQKIEANDIPDLGEEDNTVWISALMNMSAANVDENDSLPYQNQNPDQFVTPILPNQKKKQVNIVMPSPISKKEMSITFHGPVQISSTPNYSSIPVKSAPNHRDIFRCEESLPSPLDSNSGFVQAQSIVQNDIENSRKNANELCDTEDCRNIVQELSHENYDVSLHSRLWTSVSRIVKNVTDAIQGFSSIEDITPSSVRSLKRYSSGDDFMEAGPYVKRYKLTEIKCRRTIRELPPIERFFEPYMFQQSTEIHVHAVNNSKETAKKTFAHKATQTDESIFLL